MKTSTVAYWLLIAWAPPTVLAGEIVVGYHKGKVDNIRYLASSDESLRHGSSALLDVCRRLHKEAEKGNIPKDGKISFTIQFYPVKEGQNYIPGKDCATQFMFKFDYFTGFSAWRENYDLQIEPFEGAVQDRKTGKVTAIWKRLDAEITQEKGGHGAGSMLHVVRIKSREPTSTFRIKEMNKRQPLVAYLQFHILETSGKKRFAFYLKDVGVQNQKRVGKDGIESVGNGVDLSYPLR